MGGCYSKRETWVEEDWNESRKGGNTNTKDKGNVSTHEVTKKTGDSGKNKARRESGDCGKINADNKTGRINANNKRNVVTHEVRKSTGDGGRMSLDDLSNFGMSDRRSSRVISTEERRSVEGDKTVIEVRKEMIDDRGRKSVIITRNVIFNNQPNEDGIMMMRSPTGMGLPGLDGVEWGDDDDFLNHVPEGARAVGHHIPHVKVHKVKFEDIVPETQVTDQKDHHDEVINKPDVPDCSELSDISEVEADKDFKTLVDPSPTKEEMEFFNSLNKARTKPKHYVKVIKEMLTHFNDKDNTFLFPNEKVKLMTHEGRKPFVEAIKFLKNQKPLPPFELSTGMSLAARDLVADHGPRNMGGHVGSDQSTMGVRMNFYGTWSGVCGENCGYGQKLGEQMVAQLIVDDGVPSRGHRANIFKPQFLKVGVATGPHYSYGHMVVSDFAGEYYEEARAKQIKVHHDRLLYFFVHED